MMSPIVQNTSSETSSMLTIEPDFAFQNQVTSISPKSESFLSSKEKLLRDSSSDPEFEDYSLQKEEEEYTIYSKNLVIPTKIKKRTSPTAGSSVTKTKINKNLKKKECQFCGTSDTPMWRRGPTGKGTLCNACGVKWSLKFRKKNVQKNKDLDNEDKVKTTRKSSRKEKANEISPPKKLKNVILSSPICASESFSNEDEIIEQCCKLCSNMCPISYFKASSNGICSYCSMKSKEQTAKIEDYEPYLIREAKIHRGLNSSLFGINDSDEGNDSQSDLDPEKSAGKLFGSLLNVVENKLVEVHELEEIRHELDEWKEAVCKNEEQRQRYVDEIHYKIINEIQEFRQQVLGIVSSNEKDFQFKVERVESEIEEAYRLTHLFKKDIEEMKYMLFKESAEDLASRIQILESSVNKIQRIMEDNCCDLKTQVTNRIEDMKKIICSNFESSERKVDLDIAQMKKRTQEEFNSMKQQLDRMDHAFDNSAIP